ncbi:MAG: penicillin-binding protein [Actinomycetes bacterium]
MMRFIPSLRQILTLAVIGFGSLVLVIAISVKFISVPQANQIATAQTSILYYDDGVTELGRLGEANRVSVGLGDIPIDTQHAVLAAEDRGFYSHGGFSLRGFARALFGNLIGSSGAGGGSTITQQYARNAYLTQNHSYIRKYKELVLSIKLETVVSKDQILEDYLNTIYFGRGTYGIESASNKYFNKHVKDLSVSESAVLASLIQSPTHLSNPANVGDLKFRWNYVLDGMVTEKWLDQGTRASATFAEIGTYKKVETFGGPQGYLIEQVRQEMYKSGITEDQINRAGLRIVTTFNKQAEDAMIAAVKEQGPTKNIEGLRIGMASVRPGTGEVVAMYGGADYLANQFNNATQMIGQAGSTFKPFTLAAALENNVSLASTFSGKNNTMVDGYKVVNYSGHTYGDKITVLKATENSVNSAFVEIANQVGKEVVFEAAKRAGIPADAVGMEPNLAFTLGTASPHVIDIAAAYGTFASRGLQVNPVFIKSITSLLGDSLFALKPKPTQAFSTDIADTVSYALQKVVEVGTGTAAKGVGRPVAGKTGTTNDNKSALFAGYTPELATAVMFVKDGPDGLPVSLSGTGGMDTVTGGSYPARIFTQYMKNALKNVPVTKFAPLPAGQPNGANPTDSPSPSAAPTTSASSGPAVNAMIPDLSRTKVSDAAAVLQGLGFNVALQPQAGVDTKLPMFVISQSPLAGTQALTGSTVILQVVNVLP